MMRTSRKLIISCASAALVLSAIVACAPPADGARVARSTLVIGIDVSGSFRGKAHYESAIDFTANYLYAHIHGLGGLKQPTNVFVGSFGGEKPGETKSFQPIHTFQNKSVAEIAASLECDPSIVHKFLAATYIAAKSKNARLSRLPRLLRCYPPRLRGCYFRRLRRR